MAGHPSKRDHKQKAKRFDYIVFWKSYREKNHHTTIQNKLLAFKSENKNFLRHLQRTVAKESGGQNSGKNDEEPVFSRTEYHKSQSSSYICAKCGTEKESLNALDNHHYAEQKKNLGQNAHYSAKMTKDIQTL